MLDIVEIEDIIANSEPLESFELDDYTDQEETYLLAPGNR
jgi:hypothetical protein